jgi:uncharacterized protein (UPF0335 family)
MAASQEIGANSGDGTFRVTPSELQKFVERIERLEEEKKELAEGVKDVKAEAKARGYDVKVLAKIIARRKRERAAVSEEDALINLYEDALGVFA